MSSSIELQLIGRHEAWEALRVCYAAGLHPLLIGSPGTGKTELAHAFARFVGVGFVRFSLHAYTRPEDLFGPVDVQAYQQGRYERIRNGRLGDPAIGVVVLDEVSRASGAVRDMLLQAIEEGIVDGVSWRALYVGTTNFVPTADEDKAFLDRFTLWVQVHPLTTPQKARMLRRETDSYPRPVPPLDSLPALPDELIDCLLELSELAGWSDRRTVRAGRAVAALSVLDGDPTPTRRHLRICYHMVHAEQYGLLDRMIDPDTAYLREAITELETIIRERDMTDPTVVAEAVLLCKQTLTRFAKSTSPLLARVREIRDTLMRQMWEGSES